MAEGSGSIGKAYVQIVPSARGIQQALTQQMKGEIDPAGTSMGASLGSKIKKAILAAGIGTAVAGVVKTAIDEGAKLEQSIGGIETLFKSSADTVKKNAQEAFRTAGLSANEYMEQATSFAAGLVTSCGGNTAKAADVANTALIDMSDNANKMGTDMESLQNAYQGFAKQNYTMLDNLKLGYGGTKEEMQRLLADAQKLTGVKYDINNLADVYEAIHAIQESLGITGTTAKEASTTFSGSFNQMKAAAQNLLGYMATGMDITPAIQQLAESASTFIFGNALPMIGRVVLAIPGAVLEMIKTAIPIIREKGPEFIHAFVQTLKDNIPEIIKAGRELITELGHAMAEEFPQLSFVFDNLLPLVDGLSVALGGLKAFQFASGIIGQVSSLGSAFSGIMGAVSAAGGGIQGLGTVLTGVSMGPIGWAVTAIAGIGTALVSLYMNNEDFRNFVNECWSNITGFLSDSWNFIVQDAQQTWAALTNGWNQLWSGVAQGTSDIWNGIKSTCINTWNNICSTASNVWNKVKDACLHPIETLKSKIKGIIDNIRGFFAGCHLKFPSIKLPHFSIKGKFSLTPPQVPKLGIEWYAKAMSGGIILNSPTIFGAAGNKLLGGGEAGPEAVVGVRSLRSMIQQAVTSVLGLSPQSSSEPDYEAIADAVERVLGGMNLEATLVMDSRTLIKEISRIVVGQGNALAVAKGR
ncbi:hypothetical protein [Faecalibaculum rodentium]|uniref:hypothetical protein n=1 Tax=Faecalibaculum rodentium TaxID=1702221 RepID=UPI0023F2F1CB|nr:hypothetical protein [Faecalibaculum rodentium]